MSIHNVHSLLIYKVRIYQYFILFSHKFIYTTILNHIYLKKKIAFSELPLNKFKANLSVFDVWMHLILIWVLYNFKLYILSTPPMDIVVIYLQCVYHLLPTKLNFNSTYILRISMPPEDHYKKQPKHVGLGSHICLSEICCAICW
jgi:hypothetical protein